MKSVKITHFFDVIKKEVACKDEEITPATYDSTEVKQEYHCKEEFDMSWDERDNDLENKENFHALNNSSRKLNYPIVLVERLSYDTENNSFSTHKNTFRTLSVQASKKKREFLQYYRKICPECNKYESSVKPAAQCQHCDKEWNYECKKCKKQYSNHPGIIHHLKSKCLEKGFYYACFKCDYKSVIKVNVNKHLKKVHLIFHSLNRIEKFESDNIQKDTAAKLHKCTKCGDEFQKFTFLLRHMQVCGQTEDNISSNNFAATPIDVKGRCVHYCIKCNKTVTDDNIGYFHLKKCQTCDSKFSFKCKECDQVFHAYHRINNHLKFSHALNEDLFKCHQCDYKSNFLERLKKHVARAHSEEIHECHICGKKYKSREDFNTHLRHAHLQEEELQCDICSFRTKVKAYLRRHMEVHMGNKIECPRCHSTLKNKQSLNTHLSTCKKEPIHQCKKCSYKTKYKSGLTKHYENVHWSSAVKKEQCPHCAKKCKNIYSLRNHLRYCGKNAEFFCEICSRFFKSKSILKDHYVRVHSKSDDDRTKNILYFYCDNCAYKSKAKDDLAKHVVIHLDGDRKECPDCKQNLSKDYFRIHVKYCKKPLKCHLCNQLAANKESLKGHIANVHSKGKEIECPICGKTYKTESYMKTHLRRCHTEPHLQCDYCSYKTGQNYRLKRHIKSCHSKSKKRRLE